MRRTHSGIVIWVGLQCQAFVGRFDLLERGVPAHFQDRVVIDCSLRCHRDFHGQGAAKPTSGSRIGSMFVVLHFSLLRRKRPMVRELHMRRCLGRFTCERSATFEEAVL